MKKLQPHPLWLVAGLCVLLFALTPRVARAHRVIVYASAEGRTIRGSAYLSGGSRVKDETVRVLDGEGNTLGQTTTDRRGEFTYRAEKQCDHVFVVQTAAGHRATCTVKAAQLPSSLPAPEGKTPGKTEKGKNGREGAKKKTAKVSADISRGQLRRIVRRAVAERVTPLRRELRQYRSDVWFRDIVGGIGYIFGVMGLILYFKSKTGSSSR